jgi:hypothetical protein
MTLDRASLERMSAETGFYSGTLEKVMRLGEFLADVHRHPFLPRVLVLKGGTALNLGFGPPARLAEQIRLHPALQWKAENARAHRALGGQERPGALPLARRP